MAKKKSGKEVTADAMDSLFSGIDIPLPSSNDDSATNEDDQKYIQELLSEVDQLKHQLDGAIVRHNEEYQFRRFTLSKIGVSAPNGITEEEVNELGIMLAGLDSAAQFWIGDWANIYISDEMNQFERADVYSTLANQFGISKRTLQNYASTCRIIGASLRREALTFTIHREVAELPELLKGQETYFLDWAVSNNASQRQLKSHIIEKKLELSGGKPVTKIAPTQDSFLFDKTRKPRINGLQKFWSKAQNGDQKAEAKTREEIEKMRKWLDEVEDSLS